MIQLSNEYKKIMDDLEKNITKEEELSYVKEQVFKITSLFMEQLEKILEINETKFEIMEKKQNDMERKMEGLADIVGEIEKDIYMEEQEEFNLICPYCNCEFEAEIDEDKKEITCPECNNIIELDWNEEEEHGCSGHCSSCHGGCDDDEESEQDDDENE